MFSIMSSLQPIIRCDERAVTLAIGLHDQEVHLTNDQKQHITFELAPDVADSPVASSLVIFHTPIGRMILSPDISLSATAFDQIAELDYSFFRHTRKSPTTVVLPPHVDRIGLRVTKTDVDGYWHVDHLVLFDS
jgi:hypothetical protein